MSVEMVMTKVVATCRPRDSLLDAARVMLQESRGCLVVVANNGSGRVVGMLTQGDMCAAAVRSEQALGQIEVRRALSGCVHQCRPEDPVMDAIQIMGSARVRHLPVVDGEGHLLGLVSLSDIARAAAADEPGIPVLSSREVCRTLGARARSLPEPAAAPE